MQLINMKELNELVSDSAKPFQNDCMLEHTLNVHIQDPKYKEMSDDEKKEHQSNFTYREDDIEGRDVRANVLFEYVEEILKKLNPKD
jgi:hypothetical protein